MTTKDFCNGKKISLVKATHSIDKLSDNIQKLIDIEIQRTWDSITQYVTIKEKQIR